MGQLKSNEPISLPATAGTGSAAILAAVSGILPETLWEHGLVCESDVFPRRGFGKMPNPAAKMAALPKAETAVSLLLEFTPIRSSAFPAGQDA